LAFPWRAPRFRLQSGDPSPTRVMPLARRWPSSYKLTQGLVGIGRSSSMIASLALSASLISFAQAESFQTRHGRMAFIGKGDRLATIVEVGAGPAVYGGEDGLGAGGAFHFTTQNEVVQLQVQAVQGIMGRENDRPFPVVDVTFRVMRPIL